MNTTSKCPNLLSSTIAYAKSFLNQVPSRSFSSTQPQNARRATRQRRAMYRWLADNGEAFRNPLKDSTNYLGAYLPSGQLKRVVQAAAAAADGKSGESKPQKQNDPDSKDEPLPPTTRQDMVPFPMNKAFISQPVLDEELRELIWRKIMRDAQSVREVSAELGVEMNRVGAVVRLKEIEKEWKRMRIPLAIPYQNAVMSMLPKTVIKEDEPVTHESINDLPVHVATGPQIFHPTSESRQFTRVDAAKVFDEKLLPADKRIPHPELVHMHKDFIAGLSREERTARQEAREAAAENKKQKKKEHKKKVEVKTIESPRWEFQFTEINVDDIGKDGRGAKGTGWRYGKPLMDRSKRMVKIPTFVQ